MDLISISETITTLVLIMKIFYDGVTVVAGGSRSSDRSVKEETKTSRSSVVKSTDKGEEAMEWDADTKDVLQQLLSDDVTYFSLLL